jgi:hypothetical protein
MQFSDGCCLKNTQSSSAVVTRIPIRLVARTSHNILKTNKNLTRRKDRQARREQAHQGFWLDGRHRFAGARRLSQARVAEKSSSCRCSFVDSQGGDAIAEKARL